MYSPILAIGKIFENEKQAELFFCSKIELTKEQLQEIEKYGFVEFLQNGDTSIPTGNVFDSYNGGTFWMGFEVATTGIKSYLDTSNYGINTWKQLFGENPTILSGVSIW